MKIATYNVNGVNGRFPVLIRWLAETKRRTSTTSWVGCLHLRNGNLASVPSSIKTPSAGALHEMFEIADSHQRRLQFSPPTTTLSDLEVYKPERWVDDALVRPEVRGAFARLIALGWTDALRKLHPNERIYSAAQLRLWRV
jgi:hypothetical protein